MSLPWSLVELRDRASALACATWDAAKARPLDQAALTAGVLLLLYIALFLGDRPRTLFGIGQGLFRRLLAEQGFLERLRPLQ